MHPLPYALVRACLFRLEPEAAHDLTLRALATLQCTPLRHLYSQPRVEDPVTLAGLTFPNRVGLAAGLDKNATCIDGLHALGFGFIELGTVTPQPQAGNPQPRLFRLPPALALINRLGFNNDGLAHFIHHIQRARCRDHSARTSPPMLLGLNIGKNAHTPIERANDDYLACLESIYPHADYITLNISSPNTQNLRSLQHEQALHALLQAIAERRAQLAKQHGREVPVFLKIAPDLSDDDLQTIAQALRRYGTHSTGAPNNAFGLIATNTTLSRRAVAGMAHAEQTGGLSGAPLLGPSNHVIRCMRSHLGPDFPIIGVGGIMSGQDAVSKIQAGADVVQIYTGLIYKGPALVRQAALAIQAHTARAS